MKTIKVEKDTLDGLIKSIIRGWAYFTISSSPSGYNANIERVPEKKCKECGGIREYNNRVVGLGTTPREAVRNLYKELQQYDPPFPHK